MMSKQDKTRRTAQVRRYRSNERVYRLIDRRNASLMIGKTAKRAEQNDPATNYGAW